MARVELPGLDTVKPWNGYKGRIVAPAVAHLLRTLGVAVHKRPAEVNARGPWILIDPAAPDEPAYHWIAPASLAAIAADPGGPTSIAVLVWAVAKHGGDLQALDAMLRLAEDDRAFALQVLDLYDADLDTMGEVAPL